MWARQTLECLGHETAGVDVQPGPFRKRFAPRAQSQASSPVHDTDQDCWESSSLPVQLPSAHENADSIEPHDPYEQFEDDSASTGMLKNDETANHEGKNTETKDVTTLQLQNFRDLIEDACLSVAPSFDLKLPWELPGMKMIFQDDDDGDSVVPTPVLAPINFPARNLRQRCPRQTTETKEMALIARSLIFRTP